MSHYLKSVWAMLHPFKEETSPLLPHKLDDLEACVLGSTSNTDTIVLVCESLQVQPYTQNQHVHVSPFSEYHPPLRPLTTTS